MSDHFYLTFLLHSTISYVVVLHGVNVHDCNLICMKYVRGYVPSHEYYVSIVSPDFVYLLVLRVRDIYDTISILLHCPRHALPEAERDMMT